MCARWAIAQTGVGLQGSGVRWPDKVDAQNDDQRAKHSKHNACDFYGLRTLLLLVHARVTTQLSYFLSVVHSFAKTPRGGLADLTNRANSLEAGN